MLTDERRFRRFSRPFHVAIAIRNVTKIPPTIQNINTIQSPLALFSNVLAPALVSLSQLRMNSVDTTASPKNCFGSSTERLSRSTSQLASKGSKKTIASPDFISQHFIERAGCIFILDTSSSHDVINMFSSLRSFSFIEIFNPILLLQSGSPPLVGITDGNVVVVVVVDTSSVGIAVVETTAGFSVGMAVGTCDGFAFGTAL